MRKRVATNDPEVGPFVAARAKCPYNPETDHTLGVVDDSKGLGRVRGGVIYTGYTGTAIWMHVAGRDEMWITKEMLWAAFHYPFVHLGCGHVYGMVEADNSPALEFDLKLGFHVIASLPGMFASGPGLVVCMPRAECRWLRLRPARLAAMVEA
jgi:hypothetical protein